MGITVRELLETPHLQLRLHSGASGLDHEAVWTHTSDLPNPWEWLSRGDLLMTNGMSFPADPGEQAELVEQLVRVGASGLGIGEQMYCPELTAEFDAASERLGLPVLWIRYPMPFVAISRAVAEATLLEQSQRLLQTARIYDALRRTATSRSADQRMDETLTRELRCPVYICHRETGESFYPSQDHPQEVVDAVTTAKAGDRIAGAASVTVPGCGEVLIVDIPTHEHAVLAVISGGGVRIDGILLQHAATVAALDLSRTRLALEHERRGGAELLALLLEGRIEGSLATRRLGRVGLAPADSMMLAATGQVPRLQDLHVALWRKGIPHMVVHREDVAHALVPDGEDALAAVTGWLGEGCRVGVSAVLRTGSRIRDADREAKWALGLARRSGTEVARYGVSASLLGFPSPDDARALVDQHLGALIEYDAQHNTELMRTLRAFLDQQRSWQKTGAALQVHRQTVLYRVHKIEELTARDLSETCDIAELWAALQAQDLIAGRG